eukprot:UN29341
MRDVLDNPNVQYVSNQLYTSGYEGSPDLGFYDGLNWDQYKSYKVKNGWKFVPSLVDTSHYAATKSFFESNYGLTVDGYVQWKQVQNGGSGSGSTTRCGS